VCVPDVIGTLFGCLTTKQKKMSPTLCMRSHTLADGSRELVVWRLSQTKQNSTCPGVRNKMCNILLRGVCCFVLLHWWLGPLSRSTAMGEDRGWWVDQGILKRRELLGLLLHLHPRVDEVKSQHTTMKRLSTFVSSDTTIHHNIQIQMNHLN